jgi:hypothetical protein
VFLEAEMRRNSSLFVFSQGNPVRIVARRIIDFRYFDTIIIILIVLSSIFLALDNPLNDPESGLSETLTMLDFIMTALFTLEAIIKIIACGFLFNGKGSYMRSGWNILDFVIVVISVLSITL